MRIISYNVNGIRSAISKGFLTWLQHANPDVICLQEIKATEDQIPTEAIKIAGYEYQYYFSAVKKGYSGVAILCKNKPNNVVFGSGIDHMDIEGRILRVDFDDVSIMSLYLPSGTNLDRVDYKFRYMVEFDQYISMLRQEVPRLIIGGDYNICHQAIDIHDPIRNKNVSGFLPSERMWLDQFMVSGFIDSFRHFNQNPHQYSWWSYRAGARAKNKGWRLDYLLVTKNLENNLRRAVILSDAKHSDHCPVLVEMEFNII